jgi:hypothetical protein
VAEHAEIARYARISAFLYRQDEASVWQHRAIDAAVCSGNTASLALSMQLYFYRAVDEERYSDAHRVLGLMQLLAALPSDASVPAEDLVARVLAKRRAYVLRVERRWAESIAAYEEAKSLAPENSRGRAKVEGGLALARRLAGGAAAQASFAFDALAGRSVQWPDVHTAALVNSDAAKREDPGSAVPFDTV